MLFRPLLCLFLTLLCTSVRAQIQGLVQDDSGAPIPFANVLLVHAVDSSLVTGVLTEMDGRFTLTAESTNAHLLHITAIGYADWFSPALRAGDQDFGSIVLSPNAVSLATLEVRARKLLLEQIPGGTVVNVQSSLLTRGSTALQLLERAPGVFLDRRNNGISLNGRAGVTVLLNGKTLRLPMESLLATLNGMSADNVEKIELIANPGARYDAEGTAGVINIVLKKVTQPGTRGSVSLSSGYGYGPKAGANAQLQSGRGQTRWFGNLAYVYDENQDGFHGIGSQVVPALGATTFDFRNQNNKRNHSYDLGAGWERTLPTGNTIGMNLLARDATERIATQNIAGYELAEEESFTGLIDIRRNNRWQNVNPSIYYATDGEGPGLQLSADYLYFRNENPSLIGNTYENAVGDLYSPTDAIFTPAARSQSETTINIIALQADHQRSLSEQLHLEAGLKGSTSVSANGARLERQEGNEWVADGRSVSTLSVTERIGAAYTSLKWQAAEATSLTLAGRYEYWQQDFTGNVPDRSSGRFFPSFTLQHQTKGVGEWQLSYARRITRPNYNDLAAGLTYSGPVSVFSGNSLLRPTLSHQLRFGYSSGGKLLALTLQREENTIATFQARENAGNDLIVISPQNVDYQRSVDLQITYPKELTPWWSAQLTATASLREFRVSHTPTPTTHRYAALNLNGSHTITLPRKFSLELSGWYLSGLFNGSVRLQDFGAINLGVRKELPGKGGSFQLTCEDVLRTNRVTFVYGSFTPEAYDIVANGLYLPESARASLVRLTYFRSFGGEGKGARGGRNGASEERSRIGQ